MVGRIVVVEDAPATQVLMKRTLELAGFTVEAFADGEEALFHVLESPPDGVIIDVALPGMDGMEILRRMRLHPATMSTPAIIATAHAGGTVEAKAHALGASGFVAKPFNPIDLQQTVRSLVAGGQ